VTAIDQAWGSAGLPVRTLVLDTNIVLDLFVFDDLRAQPLKAELLDGRLNWLTTLPMRDELERVLGYAHIEARLALIQRCAVDILASFDRHARRVDVADRAAVTCADPDDQMFIDLAVRHQCMLLSKDAAVLVLKKKLAVLQVEAGAVLPSSA
jgi:putative PIN family toxin of toxin-antitoxin system